MSAHCLRSKITAGTCDVCHLPANPLHLPLRHRGFYCQSCCLACNPSAEVLPPATTRFETASQVLARLAAKERRW